MYRCSRSMGDEWLNLSTICKEGDECWYKQRKCGNAAACRQPHAAYSSAFTASSIVRDLCQQRSQAVHVIGQGTALVAGTCKRRTLPNCIR
jgi:hypothetical protein